jgi:hypothetical protein
MRKYNGHRQQSALDPVRANDSLSTIQETCMTDDGRRPGTAGDGDEDERDEAGFNPDEYDTMLVLERLESLEEEMQELGVKTLDEVRRRIAELHRQLDEEQ